MQRYINIDEENKGDIKNFYDVAYIYIQMQPPEVFFEKRCSKKFRKIYRKTFFIERLGMNASVYRY